MSNYWIPIVIVALGAMAVLGTAFLAISGLSGRHNNKRYALFVVAFAVMGAVLGWLFIEVIFGQQPASNHFIYV